MPNARRPSFQPRVECLEDRTLMASHLTATLEGGLLRIVGTNGNDRIVVGQQNNHISVEGIVIHVRGRSPVKSVNARDVSRIQVLGLGGDDTIILGGSARRGPDALVKPTIVWGGPGKDRIWGDMGRNTIYGQQGNDQIWSRSGHDTIGISAVGNDAGFALEGDAPTLLVLDRRLTRADVPEQGEQPRRPPRRCRGRCLHRWCRDHCATKSDRCPVAHK